MLRTLYRHLYTYRYILGSVAVLLLPVFAIADTTCTGTDGTCAVLQNPLNVKSICGLLQVVLSALLTIGTPVAVLFLLFAGFKFVTARGNPEALVKARDNLLYVFIGIALFICAWVLGQIIANTLNQLGVPLVGNCH